MVSRRQFIKDSAGTAALVTTITVLPFAARADNHGGMGGDKFMTDNGEISIHPVSHASFVMETPGLVIYADPVGEASAYADFPAADLILVTHEHGDHYNAETLAALVGDNTQIVTNPAVFGMLPDDLKAKASAIANGESTTVGDITIDAIPAYNITEERLNFHPEGRDNGYVLGIDGKRVYIAGDTEDIPEMRALENIDIEFVPMNLPFTMDVEQAASAVLEFQPVNVYPYHYRGREGMSDIDKFASLVEAGGTSVEIKMGDWYGDSA